MAQNRVTVVTVSQPDFPLFTPLQMSIIIYNYSCFFMPVSMPKQSCDTATIVTLRRFAQKAERFEIKHRNALIKFV